MKKIIMYIVTIIIVAIASFAIGAFTTIKYQHIEETVDGYEVIVFDQIWTYNK